MNLAALALKAAKSLARRATPRLLHKSLHIFLPAAAPYDNENALETFVGEHVLPIAHHLHWFWFSRYGAVGAWEVRFRFATTEFDKVKSKFEELLAFRHASGDCGDYDYIGDLGQPRFFGEDAVNRDKRARAELVYEFLTASARLFLASIVKEPDGHWRHERETSSKLNRETSLESAHHLFCNLTGVPTWAAVINFPSQNRVQIVSDLQSRTIMRGDPTVQLLDLPRIYH